MDHPEVSRTPLKIGSADKDFNFTAEPGERILLAALRQGIALPYECATGTCGSCRARLVSGNVQDLWPAAPGKSCLRKGSTEVLLCQSAPSGPASFESLSGIGRGANMGCIPRHLSGQIEDARRLTADTLEFVVALSEPMIFAAGQFALLEVPGTREYRAYSMVNHDHPAGTLTFVVKRKPGGTFSEWLFGNECRGHSLRLFGPIGKAAFDPQKVEDVLCVAGGSGIAGMMSIIRRALEEEATASRMVRLYFGVRRMESLFYAHELSELRQAHPSRFAVVIALSDDVPSEAHAKQYPLLRLESGLVHDVLARGQGEGLRASTAFLAGPPAAVDSGIRALVKNCKIPPSRILFDRFA